jgi:hypothetical protein
LHNRIQPNYCLSQFSPLLVTSDNIINPQSVEKAAGSSRVNRILIMIEERKDSNSHEGCHFHLNRARTLQESVTYNFAPKSLHLLRQFKNKARNRMNSDEIASCCASIWQAYRDYRKTNISISGATSLCLDKLLAEFCKSVLIHSYLGLIQLYPHVNNISQLHFRRAFQPHILGLE